MESANAGGNAAPLLTLPLPITLDTLVGLDEIVGKINPRSRESRALDALYDVCRASVKAILGAPAPDVRVLCWKLRQIGAEIDILPGETLDEVVDDDDRRHLSILVADLTRFGLLASAGGRA